ncbi:MAG: hypothetical protein ABJN84_17950 [Flavobacteriaceae bacterium]
MKQLIPFLAVTMLLKPFWPLAEYALNYDYIVENLCENKEKPMLNCNGKCFLAKQLAKESGKEKKSPFGSENSKLKLPIIDWFHIQTIDYQSFDFVIHNYEYYHELKSHLYISEVLHPPELG